MSKQSSYALNLVTLSTWMIVGMGSLVGFLVEQEWVVPYVKKPMPLSVTTTVDIAPAEAPSGSESMDETEDAPSAGEFMPVSQSLTPPPPMVPLEPMTELPEIPEMPQPVVKESAARVAAPSNQKKQASLPAGQRGATKNRKKGDGPPSAATSLSFGSGAGKQPAPHYPIQARRNNHQGTVVVEFLVGADGRVVNAWIKTPCPYESLNQSALSTIRSRWKFPVGEARRYRIPIVFQLK